MSDSKSILSFIKEVRRKRLYLHAFYSFSLSTLTVLSVIFITSLLKKIVYFNLPHVNSAYLAIYLFSFIIFFLLKFRRYSSILKNALYIDLRFSLKDRFSSYIDGRKRGVPEEILRFQSNALCKEIIPKLRREKILDFKSHFSFKYIAVLFILLFLLPYMQDKKRRALILSEEEKTILKEQEESIDNFIAYLKSTDLTNVLSENKIKEFSDTINDAAKKIKEKDLDKRDAIKLLSKLVDSSEKLMAETKNDLDSTKLVSDFDTDKMNKENEFKNFLNLKKKDLKDKLRDIEDKRKNPNEKQEYLTAAKDILNAVDEKAAGMMKDPPGEKKSGSKLEEQITKELLEQLRKEITKAHKELEAEGTKVDLESKLDAMEDSIKNTKKSFSDLPPRKDGDGLDYDENKQKTLVTFNSRIDRMKKGEAGVGKGPGTTNEDVGYATFDPNMPQEGEDIHDLTEADYEKIYAPSRVETEKDILIVKGELKEGDAVTMPGDRSLPMKTAVNTPYAEVFKDYRDVAQKAVDAQKVPRVYKKYVLDYFDSINPDLR